MRAGGADRAAPSAGRHWPGSDPGEGVSQLLQLAVGDEGLKMKKALGRRI
jgi:hypothetical protein